MWCGECYVVLVYWVVVVVYCGQIFLSTLLCISVHPSVLFLFQSSPFCSRFVLSVFHLSHIPLAASSISIILLLVCLSLTSIKAIFSYFSGALNRLEWSHLHSGVVMFYNECKMFRLVRSSKDNTWKCDARV